MRLPPSQNIRAALLISRGLIYAGAVHFVIHLPDRSPETLNRLSFDHHPFERCPSEKIEIKELKEPELAPYRALNTGQSSLAPYRSDGLALYKL